MHVEVPMNRREFLCAGGKLGLKGLAALTSWNLFVKYGAENAYFAEVEAEAAALPRNYQIIAGTKWLESNVASLLSATPFGDATITVTDSTTPEFLRPSGQATMLKMHITAAGTGSNGVNFLWSINDPLTNCTLFGFPLYSNLSTWTGVSANLYFMKNATFGTRIEYLSTSSSTIINTRENGWNMVLQHRDDASASAGGAVVGDTFNRANLVISLAAGTTGTFYIGPVYRNMYHKPKVCLTFDDGNDEHYSVAYAYMQPRNMVGGIAINSSSIDSGANNLTLAQVVEMQTAGWTVHNHTATHVNMASSPTAATDLATCRDYLQANGLRSGADVFIAPFGAMNPTSDAILAAQGYRYGYATGEKIAKVWDGVSDAYRLPRYSTDNRTAATAITALNTSIKYGSGLIYFTHNLGASANSSTMASTEFRLLCDHLYRLEQANVIDLVNPVSFITGMTNPRQKRIV